VRREQGKDVKGKASGDREAAAILELVAREKHVSRNVLVDRARGDAAVAASRHLAMYLVHTQLGRTLTEVGALFGRDRRTVAYACARVEDRRDRASFDQEVERLEQEIEDEGLGARRH
jgi:chromosomal replication initiation ATPase DnaA